MKGITKMQNNNNLKSSSHGTGTPNPNEKKRACAKWKHRFIEGFRQLWLYDINVYYIFIFYFSPDRKKTPSADFPNATDL